MWSSLGSAASRAAGRASGAPAVARIGSRVVLHRTAPASCQFSVAVRSFSVTRARFTPKASTSTSTPAKRTATATRKASAAKKKGTAGRKKATAKKAKAKPKTKKAAAKKPAKKRAKVLSPEEKTKQTIRELKKVALLKKPSLLPASTWLVYTVTRTKGTHNSSAEVSQTVKELAKSFSVLSTSEMENLRKTVEQNKLANNATYKAWVESHPATDIAAANNARRKLNNLTKKQHRIIRDDRQPKRPLTAYQLYIKSRFGSGDLANNPAPIALKSIGAEWQSLSAAQKQPYIDLGHAEQERYAKEVQATFGREVKRPTPPPA